MVSRVRHLLMIYIRENRVEISGHFPILADPLIKWHLVFLKVRDGPFITCREGWKTFSYI